MEAGRASQERSYPFQLSLRVRHPSIDPASISRELQIEPEHSFRAGDLRDSTRSPTVTATHVESYWLATLDPSTLLLDTELDPDIPHRHALAQAHSVAFVMVDTALTVLANSLLRRHAEFFRRIQSEGGEVRLIVAVSARKTRGFTLTPHLSKALSELRIPVDFELTHR
jgi:hypothetical protein